MIDNRSYEISECDNEQNKIIMSEVLFQNTPTKYKKTHLRTCLK